MKQNFVAAISLLAVSQSCFGQVPVIDGEREAQYLLVRGSVEVQTRASSYGEALLGLPGECDGSELDAVYGYTAGGRLYVFIAGNLASDESTLHVFLDSQSGGQNRLSYWNPAPLNRMGELSPSSTVGLTFEPGFSPDHYIALHGSGFGANYRLSAEYCNLPSLAGGTWAHLGEKPAASQGALTGGSNIIDLEAGINNSNTSNVRLSVNKGIEFSVPLSELGTHGDVRFVVMVGNASYSDISNQVLPSVPDNSSLGDPRFLKFGNISDHQDSTLSASPLWTARLNWHPDSDESGVKVDADVAGNLYVLSKRSNTDRFDVTSYSPQGTLRWHYTHSSTVPVDMAVTTGGRVYIAADIGVSGTDRDIVLIALDENGARRWEAFYNSPYNANDQVNDIEVGPGEAVYATGKSFRSGLSDDYLTLKYSQSGALLWVRRYNVDIDAGHQIKVNPVDGTATIAGHHGTGNDIVRYDSNGNFLWNALVGGTDLAINVPGDAWVCSQQSAGQTNVTRLSPTGSVSWSRNLGSPSYLLEPRLAVDEEDRSYVVGFDFSGTVVRALCLDPQGVVVWDRVVKKGYISIAPPNITQFTVEHGLLSICGWVSRAATSSDAFICALSLDGELLMSQEYSSPLNDSFSSVMVTPSGIGVLGTSRVDYAEPILLKYALPGAFFLHLRGVVDLGDRANDEGQPVLFTLKAPGNSTPQLQLTSVLGVGGTYDLAIDPTILTPGTYDVLASGSHWLAKKKLGVSVEHGGMGVVVNFTDESALVNGDCDGDNEVAIGDYAILSLSYGSETGDPNWMEYADLNGDLAVDIADYAVLSANYGSVGDD